MPSKKGGYEQGGMETQALETRRKKEKGEFSVPGKSDQGYCESIKTDTFLYLGGVKDQRRPLVLPTDAFFRVCIG